MKIIKLESENIKRLKAVQIKPDGSLIIIGGKNGAGKTSVLDSIQYALAGGDLIPSQPIRKGEKKATIIVDLEDLKVTRIFTEKSSRLVVENKEGLVHRTPQSILDSLTGHLSFDPLEFVRMDTKKQLITLKDLVGLDFSSIDKERETIFNDRTIINRETKSLDARIKELPTYDVSNKEISIKDLSGELEKAMKINEGNNAKRIECNDLAKSIPIVTNDIQEIKNKITQFEQQLATRTANLESLKAQHAESQKEIASLADSDINEIKYKIGEAEKINVKIQSNQRLSELRSEHTKKLAEAVNLTKELDRIDKNKANLLASTKFPIDGLTFDENGITYNDIPFDQCSSAEQLRISVAIGMAMNPKLKILLIRDGSLLDDNNLSLVAKMAEEANAQVWLERVGEGKEISVVIEDGSIKEI